MPWQFWQSKNGKCRVWLSYLYFIWDGVNPHDSVPAVCLTAGGFCTENPRNLIIPGSLKHRNIWEIN